MKKVISILFFIQPAFNCISQDYIKFPESNAIWNYRIEGSYISPFEWPVLDSLGHKITIYNDEYTQLFSFSKGQSVLTGGIRQDTLLKKVYFNNLTNEIVLYDFSLEQGDSIHYSTNGNYSFRYYKIVDSLGFINIGDQLRKCWYLTNSYLGIKDVWIEGIGSISRYGLLNPNFPLIAEDGSTPWFGCFKHAEVSYSNTNICDNPCPCQSWLVGIDETISPPNAVKIYPNPFNQYFYIEASEILPEFNTIEIISLNGNLMFKQAVNNQKLVKIIPHQLPKGMYIIKLTGNTGTWSLKLTKQ